LSKRVLKHAQRTTAIMVAAYVTLVLLAAAITMTGSSHGNIYNAALLASSHQPENFTELYFLHPSQLPQYSPAGKRTTVYFHIQNDSDVTQTYQYLVTLQDPDKTTKNSGAVAISANSGKSIAYNFTIPKPSEKVVITISIPGTEEYLTFRSQS
jgi:uncharacterized membrane protein